MGRTLLVCHRFLVCLVLLVFLGLTACQTPPANYSEQPVVTSKGLTVKGYIRRGVRFLEVGNGIDARKDFVRALKLDPENRTAAFMLEQVDADPKEYLGREYFPYTVRRGQVLSSIAQRFLGNSLKFYILARYNNIPNPSVVEVGQVLKIPGKKRSSLAPRRPRVVDKPSPKKPSPKKKVKPVRQTAKSEAPSSDNNVTVDEDEQDESSTQSIVAKPEPAPGPEPDPEPAASLEATSDAESASLLAPAPASEPEPEKVTTVAKPPVATPPEPDQKLVNQYHKQALILFREQQNLCGAIRAWDKVLALDPSHVSALTYKDKAQRMATKLNQSCR